MPHGDAKFPYNMEVTFSQSNQSMNMSEEDSVLSFMTLFQKSLTITCIIHQK